MLLALAATPRGARAAGNEPAPLAVLIQTTETQAAFPVVVRKGDTFTLTLQSNRTTGYQWRLSGAPKSSVVKLLKSAYNEPKAGLLGQGGTETWSFQAVGKGKTTIALQYIRPFGSEGPANKQSFAVTVQ